MPAREIKTTLAVDGEQAYKRAINDAKTSLRNMGTQLTLAQSEFKKTGDAQKLMETRAKTLKAELDQQNEIVKSLDNAMKDAVKKYGEGSKEAEKWEAELNRAKATMNALESELTNNEKGLDRNGKAFDDASAAATDFSDAVNNVGRGVSFELITSGIGRITSGFETAIKKAAELGLSMWNMMRDAASWADDEITLAKIYGVDVEELQQMQHAAKMVDTDVDTVIKARQKLMSAMGKELDSKAIQEAFQSARVPVFDQNTGKMRDMENVFWDVGASLMNMDDEVEQNKIALQLFGKSWMELKPLFDVGRTGYEGFLAEATVVPQENIEKLGALQDQLDRMDTEFQALKMSVLSELAPAFEVLSKTLTDLMAEFNAYLQTDEGKAMMDSLREALTTFFSEIKNIDLSNATNLISDAMKGITDGLNWIKEHSGEVVNALTVIAGAFGLLKLGDLVINLGKITWGFKQLFGGGGGNTPTPTTTQTPTTQTVPTTQTTGTPITSTVTKTGGFWATAKAGLASALETTAFALPFALGIDGIIQDQKLLNEWREKGNEAITRTEVLGKRYSGSEAYNEWDALNSYLRMPDMSEGKTKMDAFAEDYFKWFNDDIQNAVFDKMSESMTDEEFDAFHEAMLGIKNGEATYSEADIEARFAPLNKAIEIIEQLMEPGGGLDAGVSTGVYSTPVGTGGKNDYLTSQDVQEFSKVPEEMANQVGRKLNGLRVEMDRVTVARMVAPEVSKMIAQEIA